MKYIIIFWVVSHTGSVTDHELNSSFNFSSKEDCVAYGLKLQNDLHGYEGDRIDFTCAEDMRGWWR